MAFERPERVLNKEEWAILSQAAQDKAGDYLVVSGKCIRGGGKKSRMAEFYARKANQIYKVLIDLENEYYEVHPDEDPDKKVTFKDLAAKEMSPEAKEVFMEALKKSCEEQAELMRKEENE